MNQTPNDDASGTSADRPPVLLTIDEARGVLRISRWSIYQLINRGRLKTVRLGRRRLVAADDLRGLLDELRQTGDDNGR
jgi:excisionase family DNA binding protein